MHTTVTAHDGTPIAVATTGPNAIRADGTVVFLHGFCMAAGSWARTRRHIREQFPALRQVAYDHRGHGRSAAGPTGTHDLPTLARDLESVLAAVAPVGPVLLVGHSLGAMAALELLASDPVLINRVMGVAIIASTAGAITDTGLGHLLTPTVGRALNMLAHMPRLFSAAWNLTRTVASPFVGHCHRRSGTPRPVPHVMAEILESVRRFDVRDTLPRLAGMPSLIITGTADHITPPVHAAAIAAAWPHTRLLLLDGGDHNLPLHAPEILAEEIARLIRRATGTADYELGEKPTGIPNAVPA